VTDRRLEAGAEDVKRPRDSVEVISEPPIGSRAQRPYRTPESTNDSADGQLHKPIGNVPVDLDAARQGVQAG